MVWIYKQSTGEIFHNNKLIDKSYANHTANKNNPHQYHMRSFGPLPRGRYLITKRSSTKGIVSLILVQISGKSCGHRSFRIRGERINPPTEWASTGCIILKKNTREHIWQSKDHYLKVVR